MAGSLRLELRTHGFGDRFQVFTVIAGHFRIQLHNLARMRNTVGFLSIRHTEAQRNEDGKEQRYPTWNKPLRDIDGYLAHIVLIEI